MALTRRTLLKRASVVGLALAFGKLELPASAEPLAIEGVATAAAPPIGWLPLDGRMIKASEYPELHTALRGVYWPGVPEPTGYDDIEFAVPDFAGQRARGLHE